MDSGSKPEIPSIVTEDLIISTATHVDDDEYSISPTLPTISSGHSEKFGNPTFPNSGILTPSRRSIDISADEDECRVISPSSTRSAQSSVHFMTSTTLWRDKDDDSTSSPALLGPKLSTGTHSQRSSNTITSADEGTAVDLDHSTGLLHLYPGPATSNGTTSIRSVVDALNSSTPTHVGSASDVGHSEKWKHKHEKAGKEIKSNAERTPGDGNDEDMQTKLNLSQDEHTDPIPFPFEPHHLASLVGPKDLESLKAMGGIGGLLAGLGVDPTNGLSIGTTGSTHEGTPYTSTVEDRKNVYGSNVLPVCKSRSLLEFMRLALKDKPFILLSIVAVISLALGCLQDFGPGWEMGEPRVDWVGGVAVLVVTFIAVIAGSLNDWQKERQFRDLSDKKDERGVKVVRSGIKRVIDVKELLVGDIALLEPGEIIPCDGVFISGYNVESDESDATGEPDAVKKVSYEDCITLRERTRREDSGAYALDTANARADCFVVSSSKILKGYGKYVVIAVGQNSFNGRSMMTLRGDPNPTPLQEKLNNLSELTAKIGGGVGLTLFTALMVRFFLQLGAEEPKYEKGIDFTHILAISVTLVVVAVPGGLPLTVTSALAFAVRQMTVDNLLIRILGSCETMADATVVCTNKTGVLTQNIMGVVAGSIGVHAKFVRNLKDNKARSNAPDQERDQPQKQDVTEAIDEPQVNRKYADDFSIEQGDINTILPPQLKRLFNQSITINSTAFEDINPETKELAFVGSKTETALLQFAKDLGWENWEETRESSEIIQMTPFSSERKAMGVVVRLPSGRYRLFLKGASEILTKKCTHHIVVSRNPDLSQHPDSEIETEEINKTTMENISRTITFYTNQMLRTIALCYRDSESWPPSGTHFESPGEVPYEDLSRDMTLVAITGIEDSLRPDVREAVAACHHAGVTVKMCTGDDPFTAYSIAAQCGIYTGGVIMEGPFFRALDPHERLEVVPRLQVLARSSPEDKKILVETLRSLGEIVGVTCGGVNDGPALKAANVGFSMGIGGTEAAKAASDIILMDDNFASIVKAIMWGRCVNDGVRRFLQFQTSASISAAITTFVSAVAPVSTVASTAEYVLISVQLLWIDTIQTFAALALTTDPASRSLLDRKPDTRGKRLVTVDMIKMILGQATCQVILLLIFLFLGHKILGLDHTDEGDSIVTGLVHNALVFAQIFNLVNCRRLDNKLNIFEGVIKNRSLVVITFVETVGQILVVFVSRVAFRVAPLPCSVWGISLALGFVSIPLGALIRCIPTPPLEHALIKLRIVCPDEPLPTYRPEVAEGNDVIIEVRNDLSFFSSLRGGRVNASSLVLKSRKLRIHKRDWVSLLSLTTVILTFIASPIRTGWKRSRTGLSGSAQNDSPELPVTFGEGGAQPHPNTKPDDPAYQGWGSEHRGEPPV